MIDRDEYERLRRLFVQLQGMSYEAKVTHARKRAHEFYVEITQNYGRHEWECGNVHVSVGGLDSITLLLFLRKHINQNIASISVSALEDKSIQAVHKALGVEVIKPYKSKTEVIREFGFPVLSKEKAGKIDLLQNPTEDNATVRHAIMTGETGEYGGWKKDSRMPPPEVAPHGELVIYDRNRSPYCKIKIQKCPMCGRALGAAPLEMKKFIVNGCVERELDGERWVERPAEGEEAVFWGVYAIDHEGLAMHVADFNNKPDAVFFARCKEVANA